MKNTLEAIVTGSIFDFAGFITTRPGSMSFGSSENASPMIKLIEEWAASRNLNIHNALVQNWQDVVNNGISVNKITGKTIDRIIIDEIYEVDDGLRKEVQE